MNRVEAVNLIKEIDQECKDIRGTSLLLLEPDPNDQQSLGYKVNIKMKATPMRIRCLRTIAEQYGLRVDVAQDNWSVTIYRPREAEKKNLPSGQALM